MKNLLNPQTLRCALGLLATVAILSCNKPNVQPVVEQGFPIVYSFANESDQALKVVNFTTYTYYPKEDQTVQSYRHFKPVSQRESVQISLDGNSPNGRLGYVGCQAVSEFEIWVSLPNNKAYVSRWTTPIQTIESASKAQVAYRWPSDTLKWTKKDGIIVDAQ